MQYGPCWRQGAIFCIYSIANWFMIYLGLFFHFPQNYWSFFTVENVLLWKSTKAFAVSLSKQEAMRRRKTQRKWPQGNALHNELEIAAAGNTAAAVPARAVTSRSNFSSKRRVALTYIIARDQGLCCKIFQTLEIAMLCGASMAFLKDK